MISWLHSGSTLFGEKNEHNVLITWADPERGTGGPDPPPPPIDPDPIKTTKLPSQHSMVGYYGPFQWCITGGPMIAHF